MGFSYFQFNFIPNYFKLLFNSNYKEITYPIIAFLDTFHNYFYNIGSTLFVFIIIQIILFTVLDWKKPQKNIFNYTQNIILGVFANKFVISCVFSFIGFYLNVG